MTNNTQEPMEAVVERLECYSQHGSFAPNSGSRTHDLSRLIEAYREAILVLRIADGIIRDEYGYPEAVSKVKAPYAEILAFLTAHSQEKEPEKNK